MSYDDLAVDVDDFTCETPLSEIRARHAAQPARIDARDLAEQLYGQRRAEYGDEFVRVLTVAGKMALGVLLVAVAFVAGCQIGMAKERARHATPAEAGHADAR